MICRISRTFGARHGQIAPHRLNINVCEKDGVYLHLHEAGKRAATERKASCRVNNPGELRSLAAALLEAAEITEAAEAAL